MEQAVKLCGLWKNSKNGRTFLSGSIGPTTKLLIFQNKEKRTPKSPDYTAYMVTPAKKTDAKAEAKAAAEF